MPAIPKLDQFQESRPTPLTADALRLLLAEQTALLGPCLPLPALYEEVLRAWRGRSVNTERFRRMEALLATIRQAGCLPFLAEMITDPEVTTDVRWLAAALWAHTRPEMTLSWPADQAPGIDDPRWIAAIMAQLPRPDLEGSHPALLERLLAKPAVLFNSDALPLPLPLLAFLKGLCDESLSQSLFNAAVITARVLHPGVSAHRPLARLHRLLDYLDLSAQPWVQRAYRQLVAQVWPVAGVENWPAWQWVTVPGGPELFPRAVAAVGRGECTIVRLHELRYAPLPDDEALSTVLAGVDPAIVLLLCWLRPAVQKRLACFQQLITAARWMVMSNSAAAIVAYAAPSWWVEWRREGMPATRRAMTWLQRVPLPPDTGEDGRYAWLERSLLPDYGAIVANLLLVSAARGERVDELVSMAEEGHLPAVRALALAPKPDERIFRLLRRGMREGGRPLQAAARAALEHLARRQGLPGVDELERQHLLAAAWELGPLAGERVRVGWEEGLYRLRLSLHEGKVRLDVLGPHGSPVRVPPELRASEAYQEARAAQRETQAQYRLFRQHLERYLLEGTPLPVGEFRYLLSNPIFAHLAERLVWRSSEGASFLWAGPDRWETLQGEPVELKGAALTLALVHPVALSRDGTLGAWQSLAADRRLVQPIRQLFREVYVAGEEEGERCRRFAGRLLDPGRGYAVLRAAGFAPGSGTARREWPRGLTAHLCWAQDAAGRDLFGPHRKTEVASGDIWFTQGGEALPLHQVDPVAFSETLRVADLLTTRAAVGDAELTSRETVALRALLLREVARSFRLTNIAVPEDGRYGLVLGARATYRINLTSGTVYLEPEGRQLVVPRGGSSWQPVEDSDATGDIIALVLELAHDEEMTDPAFLAQLAPVPVP
ncbi:MAG: DUF4132 domain-containing protein [Armatimonadota bacterium]